MVSCGEKEKLISFTQSILMAGRNLVPVNTQETPFILMWWLNCSGMRIWPCVTQNIQRGRYQIQEGSQLLWYLCGSIFLLISEVCPHRLQLLKSQFCPKGLRFVFYFRCRRLTMKLPIRPWQKGYQGANALCHFYTPLWRIEISLVLLCHLGPTMGPASFAWELFLLLNETQ